MDRTLEVISPTGDSSAMALSAGPTRIEAAAGFTYRISGRAGEPTPSVMRDGSDLVVEGLTHGDSLTVSNFYTECSPTEVCSFVLSGFDGVANASVTPATQPLGALSSGRFLMLGGDLAVAEQAPANWQDFSPWWLAGIGLGGAAVAGAVGGGSDSAVGSSTSDPAVVVSPPVNTDPPATVPQPVTAPPPVPTDPLEPPPAPGPSLSIAADTGAGATINGPITYTFTFSAAVDGFSAGDIDVAGGTVTRFSGTGAIYTAEITPDAGQEGQLSVQVGEGAASGTRGAGSMGASAIPIAFDRIRPDLDISDDITGAASGPVVFTFTFTEPVVGFTIDDISIQSSGANPVVGSLERVDGSTYTLAVLPVAGDPGLLRVSVADDRVEDDAGNGNIASLQIQPFSDSGASLAAADIFDDPAGYGSAVLARLVSDNDSTAGMAPMHEAPAFRGTVGAPMSIASYATVAPLGPDPLAQSPGIEVI